MQCKFTYFIWNEDMMICSFHQYENEILSLTATSVSFSVLTLKQQEG